MQEQAKNEQELRDLANLTKLTNEAKNAGELAKIRDKLGLSQKKANIADLKEQVAADKAKLDLERRTALANLSIQNNLFGLGAAIAKDGSKAQFIIQKAGAIAGTIVATQLAVAKAATIDPSGILAAKTQIAGNIALGTIIATAIKGFQEGGILGGASATGDRTLFRGNRDEVVLNGRQQAQTLFEIANGRGGTDQTQQAQGDIVVEIDGREIARAVREQVKEGFKVA